MITIQYKGANSIKIAAKKTTVVTDPKLSLVGLKDVSVKDDVELISEDKFRSGADTARIIFNSPGEYEIGDFVITGVPVQVATDPEGQNGTAYRVVAEDVAIGILGNISPKLDEDQLEKIGLVDVLVIPVGGNGYTLDAKDAASLVRQIEPKIVIPVHYKQDGVAYEVPQEDLAAFTTEMAMEATEADALKIKSPNDIPASLTIMALQRA